MKQKHKSYVYDHRNSNNWNLIWIELYILLTLLNPDLNKTNDNVVLW